jgi:hypothetical protein
MNPLQTTAPCAMGTAPSAEKNLFPAAPTWAYFLLGTSRSRTFVAMSAVDQLHLLNIGDGQLTSQALLLYTCRPFVGFTEPNHRL